MSTQTEKVHVIAGCTVDLQKPRVDAAALLELRVRVTGQPPCDFEGEVVAIQDEHGHVLARAPLRGYDETSNANLTDLLQIEAPAMPGKYIWIARLAGYGDDTLVYEGASAPFTVETSAHKTEMVVWDVPGGVMPGTRFSVNVGIKCACGCSHAQREFTIVDNAGTVLARERTGSDIWPKSKALYYARVELTAPNAEGVMHLSAQCAPARLSSRHGEHAIVHEPGKAAFHLRSVHAPEHRVRIEAWDADVDIPLVGARVSLHPFSATADASGVAELEVPGGQYRLFVSKTKFTTFGMPIVIAADLEQRVALHHEPPPNRE